MGECKTFTRPHPLKLLFNLRTLVENINCSPIIKDNLTRIVNEMEKLIRHTKTAGFLLSKTMIHLKKTAKHGDETELGRMIKQINQKLDRMAYMLGTEDKDPDLINRFFPGRIFQCYIAEGVRIVSFDDNLNLAETIDKVNKFKRDLRYLEASVNSTEVYDNIKEFLMDRIVDVHMILAIDAVTALNLQPHIDDLNEYTSMGRAIFPPFMNKLRTFHFVVNRLTKEAWGRRARSKQPLREIITKSLNCSNWVKFQKTATVTEWPLGSCPEEVTPANLFDGEWHGDTDSIPNLIL